MSTRENIRLIARAPLRFLMSARQKVIWLGVSGLTLNFMSWACKGYTSTSEMNFFDSNVKQKVLNDEKREKHQSLIPVYATFCRFIMTLKWYFFHLLTFQ